MMHELFDWLVLSCRPYEWLINDGPSADWKIYWLSDQVNDRWTDSLIALVSSHLSAQLRLLALAYKSKKKF